MSGEGVNREREWYADGLRFACTSCGNCCSGPPGAVWMTDAEALRLAAQVGLELSEFLARFARRLGNRWSLQEIPVGMDGGRRGFDCIFLDRESVPGKAVCSVYDARPTQCRTWPFWSEMLESERAWLGAKRVTPCPGMGSGPLYSLHQINVQRDTDRHEGAAPAPHP